MVSSVKFSGLIHTRFYPQGENPSNAELVMLQAEKLMRVWFPTYIAPGQDFHILHNYEHDRKGREALIQDRYYLVEDTHEDNFFARLKAGYESVKVTEARNFGKHFNYIVNRIPGFGGSNRHALGATFQQLLQGRRNTLFGPLAKPVLTAWESLKQ